LQSHLTNETVFVLDFGGQYTQLIARRIRECHVFSQIVPFDAPIDRIIKERPKGIIFSGGPSSVYEDGAPRVDPRIYELGIPILGICYGHQMMAHQLGGEVAPADMREYGKTPVQLSQGTLSGPKAFESVCWMSHGDQVLKSPSGFKVTASTDTCPVALMENEKNGLFGVQFHPEVTHTPFGKDVLARFLNDVCKFSGSWTPASFIDESVKFIRERSKGGKILCAVSGGVDSMVVAALTHHAVGEKVTCVFVDHGLLRKGEAEQVRKLFSDNYRVKLIAVDARQRFLERLEGVTDPEQKRKIIGAEFIRVFEEHADEFGDCQYLAQGTLYPDVIESGTKHAAKIKTHHNVGGLPDWMRLEVIEPLRYLFKDEARAVGKELGLPDSIVMRQPFPGPGLAVRIVGQITEEALSTLREADAIVLEEIERAGILPIVWQSFAVLLDIKSVGVMGDQRSYQKPIVIRVVSSEDAMTADAVQVPWDALERMSNRIVNEVPGVNRVLYDLSSKPPATIEWE
jgi:GMP synthase (glutamine-hydrolysing)